MVSSTEVVMQKTILKALSLTFAVGALAAVVVHAGCKTEEGLRPEPSNPSQAAKAAAPATATPSAPSPALATAPATTPATVTATTATVTATTAAAATGLATASAAPTAPPKHRYFPATKAAPVFHDDDWDNGKSAAPQQQAPQPPPQQRVG
jgi:hypothetical protein